MAAGNTGVHARNFQDLSGQTLNNWTVLRIAPVRHGLIYWQCRCVCGKESPVSAKRLRNGQSKSCGCSKPSTIEDLTGRVYGRLTVLRFAGKKANGNPLWLCRCECGTERTIIGSSLRSGRQQSCGCWNKERIRRHGKCKTPEYVIWAGMKQRCRNPLAGSYRNYGGRGIAVCERWSGRRGFESFLADMGPRPSPQHTIERINNELDYSPENCAWALPEQQANNKRTCRYLTHDGCMMTIAQWARHVGLEYKTLFDRLKHGWEVAEALNTPPQHNARWHGSTV